MKLEEFINELERQYADSASVSELGTSRKGNRKLEIQLFSYEPSACGDTTEYVSWFIVVVDGDENVLHSEQTV